MDFGPDRYRSVPARHTAVEGVVVVKHKIRSSVLSVLCVFAAGGVTIALAQSARSNGPIAKTQADAFAKAVNLRARDLPGATALQNAVYGQEAVQYKALKCGRRRNAVATPVGGGESWLSYRQGSAASNVGSIVVVAPSQHVVEGELAVLESSPGRACLAHALGSALTFERHHRLESSHAVMVAFHHGAGLGRRVVAVHVIAKLPPIEGESTSPTRKAKYINIEAVLFRVGPAEIAFLALGATRFPPATEARLLRLLYSRAETHKL